MAMRGVDFKWYDGFFLSMLATSIIIVSINWKRYHLCTHPLHIWIVVDYTTVFIFRLLMFVDNGLAAGMGFARSCLPEEGQKWGFLIWLLFSYCGLVCIACISAGKWLTRRQAHLQRAQHGIPISEYGVLVDMIRVPEWAFEAAGQELSGMGQDTAYHPGLYLTAAQREAVEALIQELPKFRLKGVPTDCSECPICLEEFCVGNEVRGLPCAHNFHVECIDQWLRLNVKCPRCRCSVFPNLDLSALSNLQADSERPSPGVVATASRYVRNQQPTGQSYLLRLQELLLRSVRGENAGAADNFADIESGGVQVVVSQVPPNIIVPVVSYTVVDRALDRE
ncbi:E3 ubiquitin-protein ligase SIS3-like isoform X2 [Zingiber officinale]|uniref:E3 ubiquitin-protein ligase SIS3-like isoform X2 n=1 Tax=Zingiber officinale TaxID=94328 RepID=UPI001C4CC469|nr:E3 ubiquitin-protein ligase SIS3-like isoform X2 [Zingiber officinale]XP_042426782.1 E3 ubiquitin-protein ligase SIS3-like isoform X2 [Zingiber officinale]